MSLDVYLQGDEYETACRCHDCDHEHTRKTRDTYYDGNITHNLGSMADAAGIYPHLWRPDEIGVTRASELIEPLAAGLAKLRSEPEHYRVHNPPNGWGSYEGLVRFIAEYLDACRAHPEATVRVSR